jgi:hypothetical protein
VTIHVITLFFWFRNPSPGHASRPVTGCQTLLLSQSLCRASPARAMAAPINSVIETRNDIDVNKIVIDVIL